MELAVKKFINISWNKLEDKPMMEKTLEVKAGVTIYASTGMNGFAQADRMSSMHFYFANNGSRLHLVDQNYYYNVATYTMDFDEKYLYTYDYAPEQIWGTYAQDLSGDTYIQHDYVFQDKRYFRVCLKRVDNADFTIAEERRIDKILKFYQKNETSQLESKVFFKKEIVQTVETIQQKRNNDTLVFVVLTDTHYTVNGTWSDTVQNIYEVHKQVAFDSIMHLGDLTDGMVAASITRDYAKRMIDDLQSTNVPVHIVLGNHDANYFAGNPDVMTIEEQIHVYQQCSVEYKSHETLPYYYTDYTKQGVRCIFLSSYDNNEKLRYGFEQAQVIWVNETLECTPRNYKILIFSHDAPLARLDYWSEEIRNGEALMTVLEEHHKKWHNILAYMHGHTHADYIYTARCFPIVSIGCAKCEDMQEKKPEGAVTRPRKLGTVTQELWDTIIVNPRTETIDFIRFGAGNDRYINSINGLDKAGE